MTKGYNDVFIDLFKNPLLIFSHELKGLIMPDYVPNTKNPKHVADYFKLINDAPHDTQIALLVKHGKQPPFDMLLSLNFNSEVKLDLPPGMPPCNRDEATHPDMMGSLSSQIGRLKSCTTRTNIKKMDKERVFIQVIETIPPCDADILVAAKDKTLCELYPNITAELVKEVYPHYVK